MDTFKIQGLVKEDETGRGVSGLFVKAYDQDLLFDDLMGTDYSKSNGYFEVVSHPGDYQEFLETKPDVYLKVYSGDRETLLHTTEDAVLRNAEEEAYIEVRIPREVLGDSAPTVPGPSAPMNLNAAIYPVSTSVAEPDAINPPPLRDVGVCFSGGGSRSLSAVMGQLRGLHDQGWIGQVGTISAVSGGCWASSLYTFLPPVISHENFLGTGIEPGQLKWDAGNVPQSLSYLPPNNLGLVPTRLGWDALLELFIKLIGEGFDDFHQFWRVAIGQKVLQDYGLYQADANHDPTRFYSWTEDQFNRTIKPHNSNLTESDFHFARNRWPMLIMNGSMFFPQGVNQLAPVASSLRHSGIRGTLQESGQVAGGGFVDTFGMGSQFVSTASADRVDIQQQRPFSIADMASISSAAFAEEFHKRYGVRDLEPQYTYWPVAGGGSAGQTQTFADGGLLENSGLADLLANTLLTKVVVFVNGSQVVGKDLENFENKQVPDAIPPLFGLQPFQAHLFSSDSYPPYAGAADPKDPLMRHNQVFPSDCFKDLLDGLINAANDFQDSAIYFQPGLELQENPWFGITSTEKRKVDVLWVCNNQVKSWEGAITDRGINDCLDIRLVPESCLWNFPYYGTLEQLHLTPQQVNMLAQLSWWNVTAAQNQAQWQKIFGA